MKYVMLLHFPDTYMGAYWEQAEIEAHQREYQPYKEQLLEEGVFHAGEALQPPDITTTGTVRNEDAIVTDGQFVESAEVMALSSA